MWISKVEDLVSSEQKDSIQVSDPLMNNNNRNYLRSSASAARRTVVQRMVSLTELTRESAAAVSFSRNGLTQSTAYVAAISNVDESLFAAD